MFFMDAFSIEVDFFVLILDNFVDVHSRQDLLRHIIFPYSQSRRIPGKWGVGFNQVNHVSKENWDW